MADHEQGKKKARVRAGSNRSDHDGNRYKEWEWLLLHAFAVIGFVTLIAIVTFEEKGTRSYYRTNNSLFGLAVLTCLSIILRTSVNNRMYRSLRKVFKRDRLSLYEKGDILLAFTYFFGLASFFVVDMSFFEHYGVRVGTVVVLSAIQLIRQFLISRKKGST